MTQPPEEPPVPLADRLSSGAFRLLVGLFLLMILMSDFGRFLQRLFSDGLLFLRQMLEAMAPLT